MPITPDRRKLYPPAKVWAQIRAAVLKRAGGRCDKCGLQNGALGFRDRGGNWRQSQGCCDEADKGERPVTIVLTIHHDDGDPRNNDGFEATGKVLEFAKSNLQALCQQCHNRADGPMRAKHAAETRFRKRMERYRGGLFAGADKEDNDGC